jgi:hypothetical protein
MGKKRLEKQLETLKHDGKWLESYEIVKELNVKYTFTFTNYA